MKINIDDIDIRRMGKTVPADKKMQQAINYYNKLHQFKSEIVLINKNQLVDGYTSYLVARLYGITELDCLIYSEYKGFHNKIKKKWEDKTVEERFNENVCNNNIITKKIIGKRISSGRRKENIRKELYQKSNKCTYCGKVLQIINNKSEDDYLTLDHIIPVALGGLSDIDNLQSTCKSCNGKKACYVAKDDYITYISNRGLLKESDLMKLVDLIF